MTARDAATIGSKLLALYLIAHALIEMPRGLTFLRVSEDSCLGVSPSYEAAPAWTVAVSAVPYVLRLVIAVALWGLASRAGAYALRNAEIERAAFTEAQPIPLAAVVVRIVGMLTVVGAVAGFAAAVAVTVYHASSHVPFREIWSMGFYGDTRAALVADIARLVIGLYLLARPEDLLRLLHRRLPHPAES